MPNPSISDVRQLCSVQGDSSVAQAEGHGRQVGVVEVVLGECVVLLLLAGKGPQDQPDTVAVHAYLQALHQGPRIAARIRWREEVHAVAVQVSVGVAFKCGIEQAFGNGGPGEHLYSPRHFQKSGEHQGPLPALKAGRRPEQGRRRFEAHLP